MHGIYNAIGIKLYHNDERITGCYNANNDTGFVTVSNAFVLQLEKGDVVYMVLGSSYSIWNDSYNRTTLSGFLLFAL